MSSIIHSQAADIPSNMTTTAWIFMGLGEGIFFALFLRSRYLPRALASFGVLGSCVLVAVPVASLAYPRTSTRSAKPEDRSRVESRRSEQGG
jgi:hypothetical protein